MDRYSTATPIAEGGTSDVYRAVDQVTGKPVALKVLRHPTPEHAARMEREVRLLRDLDHPHIARCVDAGEVDGRPYLATEFIEGDTLDRHLADATLETSVRMMLKVVRAIAFVHDHGILHRDLKPANVLVHRADGEPVIVDFGLAAAVADPSQTATGALMGTPAYMAPEQARGDRTQISERTDVYGLGAILYRLLVRRAPHVAETSGDIIAEIISQDPDRPRSINRTLPVALEAIVMTALSRDSASRYASASAMANDLEAWLAGKSIAAMRFHRLRIARRYVRRHSSRITAAVLLLTAVSAVGFIQWRAQRTAEERSAQGVVIGEMVADARNRLRLAHMAPPHDIRDDQRAVREQIETLRRAAVAPGTHSMAEVHRAIGVLHGELAEYEEALPAMQRAVELGCSVCTAELGLIHLRLYEDYLEEAASAPEIIPDRSHHLEQARELLAGETLDGVTGVARSALMDGAVPSTQVAEAHLSQFPWEYEVLTEMARANLRRAMDARRNDDLAIAEEHLRTAQVQFRRAAEVGRSDPEIFEGACRTALRIEEVAAIRSQAERIEPLSRGIRDCDTAIAIDPDKATAYADALLMIERRAIRLQRLGKSARNMATEGVVRLRRLPPLVQETPDLLHARGRVLAAQARILAADAAEQESLLRQALGAIQEAQALDPDRILFWQSQQVVLTHLIQLAPTDASKLVQATYEMAKKLSDRWPRSRSMQNSLGTMLIDVGYTQRIDGKPDETIIRRAVDILSNLIEKSPEYTSPRSNLLLGYWEWAMTRIALGREPEPVEAQADALFARLQETYRHDASSLVNYSGMKLELARWRLDTSQLVGDRIEASLTNLERLRELDKYLPCDFAYAWWLKSRAAASEDAARAAAETALKHADQGSNADCQLVTQALIQRNN